MRAAGTAALELLARAGSALGLVLLIAMGARADTSPAAPPATAGVTLGELRVLGPTRATSTSDCIGEMRTPLCAVESFKACHVWADLKLCRDVDYYYPWINGQIAGPDPSDDQALWLYEVTTYRVLDEASIPPAYTKGRNARKLDMLLPGDVAIAVLWHLCGPKRQCTEDAKRDQASVLDMPCAPVWCRAPRGSKAWARPDTFFFRRAGDIWEWLPIDERHLPDGFWGR